MLCVPAVWAAEPVSEVPPPHQSVVLDSAVMKEQRRINVYLPSTLQEKRRYPVIYMPDGGLAEDFPHVANTIDAAIREGRMAPVILVGIENTQRRRDMTGPTTVKKDRKIAPVVGGAAEFRKFIATELVPWVEANHPASERRGIIGESAAGLFIVETFFEMPGLFETSIALDPSLWWNAGKLAKDAGTWLMAHPETRGRLFVAWAEPETIGPNVRILDQNGVRFTYLSPMIWPADAPASRWRIAGSWLPPSRGNRRGRRRVAAGGRRGSRPGRRR